MTEIDEDLLKEELEKETERTARDVEEPLPFLTENDVNEAADLL